MNISNNGMAPMMPINNKKDANVAGNATDGYNKLSDSQITEITNTPQIARSDCYLVSTLKAFAKSTIGKFFLKESIKTSPDGDTFEITFKKYDKDNTYKISNDEKYNTVTGRNDFNATGAVETATNYVVQDRRDSKPAIIRTFAPIICADSPLECNLASVYMEALTGKKPVSLGDRSMLPLSSKKEIATKLLDRIGSLDEDKHSFVAGSKLYNTKNGIGEMHYYVIKNVDKENQQVQLVNPRYFDLSDIKNEKQFETDLKSEGYSDKDLENAKDKVKNMPDVYTLSYKEFMNNFRSIVGYFDENK